MTSLNSDYLNLNQPSGVVELYQIDLTPRGGSMVYLTPQQTASGTVIHNGLTYTSIPLSLSRAKMGTSGTLPQPQLSVAVTENPLLRAALAAYGDLAGCKVKKFHTFAKYLDAANTTRINLLDWSQDLSNAAWTKSATTISSNVAMAPDGTMTADLILDTAVSAQHYISKNTTGTLNIADPINVSAYVKYGGVQYVLLYISSSSTSGVGGGPVIDTINGTIVQYNNGPSITNAVVTPAGDGWYRVSFTCPANAATTTARAYINPSPSASSPTYVGTGTNGVYLWGYQVQRVPNQAVDASMMTALNASITLNQTATLDPWGGTTADIISENTATSTHFAYQNVTGFTADQDVTFTIHLRAGSVRNQAMVRFISSTALPTTAYCVIDLLTGAVSSVVGLSKTPVVVAMQGTSVGWYRLSISVKTTAAGTLCPAVMLYNATNTYTGGNWGIYVCGGCLTWDYGLKDFQYTTTTHAPFADPTAVSAVDSYIISQMIDFNPDTVTWKLTTPIDRPNLILPRLQYLKDDVGNHVYAPGLNRVME